MLKVFTRIYLIALELPTGSGTCSVSPLNVNLDQNPTLIAPVTPLFLKSQAVILLLLLYFLPLRLTLILLTRTLKTANFNQGFPLSEHELV